MSIFDFLDKYEIPYKDKELILRALKHSSYTNEHNKAEEHNERLEFMGDAVLEVYASDKLFHITPALKEGQMSKIRAKLVCEETLSMISKNVGLPEFLLLGAGEEKMGGRERNSLIADMFEALIGALYLDTGINTAYKFLDTFLIGHLDEINKDTFDYKTKLQELVQADSSRSIVYRQVSQTGPSNAPYFVMAVEIDGLVYGTGEGPTKKEAEKMAAKNALDKLVK